ncbi:amidohydrolase [Polymorphum gilvum]|uniref:Amidohydrolase family protein n=1 Tax=Polymorphum gilvum (strain LMG 25793 / CGMCC 1.9160 / SL003B-26A1) TaxID=991905 RepID=F2IYU4_POLGS|nr:amidohydrolase [Polymorphum gilvum]ADZ70559.1 Amidohydrolase family protein [Polymorphum gilvum SL003B-26A1]
MTDQTPSAAPPALTNRDVADLTDLRRRLHRRPEVSRAEAETAAAIRAELAGTRPDRILTGLGGHGVAAVYDGSEPGPTMLVRCELDGLPIEEQSSRPHRSEMPGRGHLCGHDGHMAILVGLARLVGRRRPQRGRLVLLFQPAEEDGSGAAAVIADPRFAAIAPDYAFALHNLPGRPFGHADIVTGPVNCASRGLRLRLTGRTAHASQPDRGISPMAAVARLMPALTALSDAPAATEPPGPDFRLVTVTHARMGEPAFGIAPGEAEIWATLRTLVDTRMEALCTDAEALARDAAAAGDLGLSIAYDDVFHHCENDPDAVALIRAALAAEAIPSSEGHLPMRGSEDFGRFGLRAKAAMVFLGAGADVAGLHNPDYDFSDDLIPIGVRLFARLADGLVGFRG